MRLGRGSRRLAFTVYIKDLNPTRSCEASSTNTRKFRFPSILPQPPARLMIRAPQEPLYPGKVTNTSCLCEQMGSAHPPVLFPDSSPKQSGDVISTTWLPARSHGAGAAVGDGLPDTGVPPLVCLLGAAPSPENHVILNKKRKIKPQNCSSVKLLHC